LLAAAVQGAGLAALGLASIVLGRALGPSGYGTFAVAFNLQTFLASVASLGLGAGIAYEVASGRWRPRSALRDTVAAALVLGGIAAAAGIALYVTLGDSLLPDVSAAAAILLFGAVPMVVVSMLVLQVATALERYEAAALVQGAPVLIAIFASVLALLLDLNGAVAAIGGAVLLVGLLGAIWALRLAAKLNDGQEDGVRRTQRLRQALGFGVRLWASELLLLLNMRGDLILVAALASSREAGLYAVAATLTTVGLIVPQALAQVLLPRVATMEALGASPGESARKTVGRAGRQATLIAGATSLLLLVAILLVPTVYGSSFDDSVLLGFVLLPGIAALGVSRVLASALAGLGRPDTVLRLSAAVVLPSVVAYILVIPPWEAIGAAVVSTVSYVSTLCLLVAALRRRVRLPVSELIVPRRSDVLAYREILRGIPEYVRAKLRSRNG
jgi:O-antigen/teichoic acid export membrane protein